MSVPFPTLRDLAISTEILFFLWPMRFLQKWLEGDISKHRRAIIQQHLKHKHKSPLRRCHEGSCTLLTEVLPADHF